MRIRPRWGGGLAMSCLLITVAPAAELSPEGADPALVELHRQVSLAGGASYLDHDEAIAGRREHDTGGLPQLRASGGWLFDNGLFFEVGAAYSFGETDQDRSGPDTPRNDRDSDNDLVSTYGQLGFSAAASNRVLITPYLSYGYQHWQRDIRYGIDYSRDYDTHFLGGGVMVDIGIVHNLIASIDLLGASTFANEQTLDIQAPGFAGQTVSSDNAPLARAELSLDYLLAPHVHIFTAARYRYISRRAPEQADVAPSGTAQADYDSDTHEVNLNAGLRLTF
ncbi:MAG: hypothetical protein CMP08_05495 [Xanthomonadales bacterium]|nr:hypothetical protein [Xanthomonadales bacterium]